MRVRGGLRKRKLWSIPVHHTNNNRQDSKGHIGHDAEIRTRHLQNAMSRLFPVRQHIRFLSHVFRYGFLPSWPMSLLIIRNWNLSWEQPHGGVPMFPRWCTIEDGDGRLKGVCIIPWDPNSSSSQQSAYTGKFWLSEAKKKEKACRKFHTGCAWYWTRHLMYGIPASYLYTTRTFNCGHCLSYKHSCLIKHSIHADASFGPISQNKLSTKMSCFNPSTSTLYV